MPTHSETLTPYEVLVVDDEPDVLELIAEYLRNRGLKVTTACEGAAAVAAIRQEAGRFRLVVTDLQLPSVDGLEVLRAAREVNPTCFVVIVTGYASLDSAIQAVRLGAYDYLTKPFSLGQLDVLLRRVQDRLTLEEENRRLLRQLGDRDAAESRQPLLARLDAIDNRLSRLELLLRESLPGSQDRQRVPRS